MRRFHTWHVGHSVGEQFAPSDEQTGGAWPADEFVRREEDRVEVCLWARVGVDVYVGGSSRKVPEC